MRQGRIWPKLALIAAVLARHHGNPCDLEAMRGVELIVRSRLLARTSKLLASGKNSVLVTLCLLLGILLLASDCSPAFIAVPEKLHSWKAAPHWFPERNSIVFSHGDYNEFYEHLYEVSRDGSHVRLIPGIQKDNAEDRNSSDLVR